jgi:hypothetical protein
VKTNEPLVLIERKKFHANLLGSVISVKNGIPSIADSNNGASIRISNLILKQIGELREVDKQAAQTAGDGFEKACCVFLCKTFLNLSHLRPGQWDIHRIGRKADGIASCDQYSHLKDLAILCKSNPTLAATLGMDYIISPDVVILRQPEPDTTINQNAALVDSQVANLTPIRKANSSLAILHASVSCKLTLRSDRAQNARSEALNLIKNRKGQAPHIVVVTAEPLPSRLASLAMGTGEIDCVYHFALPELQDAIDQEASEDSKESLRIMIEGKRLRDIADLPLDLAT